MTVQEIKNTLRVVDDDIITSSDNLRFIGIDVFLETFGDCALNYEDLVRHPNTDDVWKERFNEWKEKGYID